MDGMPAEHDGQRRTALLLRVLGAGAGLVLLVLVGRRLGGAIPRFTAWVEGLGLWAPLVFVVGYAVATVAFIPGSALTLAAGAAFGLWRGTLFAFLGASLGATAAFLVARYGARSWVERKLAGHERFRRIDRAVGAEGGRIVALLRLAPIFPFNLLNYGLGLTSVRLGPYVLACLAMLPGTLMYVYFGKVGRDAAAGGKTAWEWLLLAVGLAAVVAVTAIVTRIARRALAEAVGAEDA
jgi:uncharacterized membrane protein YdjX (TVP38/TMEM64 family)